jgi:hypothetical protein
MRDLKDFSAKEWLQLLPLQLAFKQLRNDLWLAFYKKQKPKALDEFLRETIKYRDQNIALVVAFEQPWALDWLLRMAARNLTDTTVIVFDNSLKTSLRADIEKVCQKHQTPYLALPPNPTRHVNRSHGMAMTWIFYNVVRAIKPRLFAFIDHDLIPVQKVSFSERLSKQPFYGFLRVKNLVWNLWAGYCLYDFDSVANLKMNFLYDFSRGLDTGGRNWQNLYKDYQWQVMKHAVSRHIDVTVPPANESTQLQIIDDCWIHIGGIGYNGNFAAKSQFCSSLAQAFDNGTSLAELSGES